MEGNSNEGKRLRLADLNHRYTEMGEEIAKLVKELGYGIDGGDHIKEFEDILNPAGFYVYQADKVENWERDMYVLKIGREATKFYSEDISSQNTPPVCQGESRCQADSPDQHNHGN